MSWLQTWMIDGKIICSGPIAPEHVHSELHPPVSLAFFCPQCGEVWARRIITPNIRWNVLTRECRKHTAPRYCEPEGSVWINYNEDYLEHLPPEVLRYETLLRLDLDK